MRVVLSRKGFDASAGGFPSPILPSGTLLSLPIPEDPKQPAKHSLRYADIRWGRGNLGTVVQAISQGRIAPTTPVHLDPDIRPEAVHRPPRWRPLFGQAAAAESHLRREQVGPGDLFLFFGWFRRVDEQWRYYPTASDLHVIFGWLQVEHRIVIPIEEPPEWARHHPHLIGPPYAAADAVYVARSHLDVPGLPSTLPGAGIFPRIAPTLVLTRPGATRSHWGLPPSFVGPDGNLRLSYHRGQRPSTTEDGSVTARSVGRGQEFVVEAHGLLPWLQAIFAAARPQAVEV